MGIAVIMLGLFMAAAVPGYAFYYRDRIAANVSISGISVGGKTLHEARMALEAHIKGISERLAVSDGRIIERATFTDVGISVMLDGALDEAWQFGHGRHLGRNFGEIFNTGRRKNDVPLALRIDEEVFASFLDARFDGRIEQPARNADIQFDPMGGASVVPAHDGIIVDREVLHEELIARLKSPMLAASPIILRQKPDKPLIATEQAQAVRGQIDRLLATSPYFLFGNGKRFVIGRSLVAEWLQIDREKARLAFSFSDQSIDAYLAALAPAMNREARNVEIGADAQGEPIHVVRPSEDALRLNTAETRQRIAAGLLAARKNTDAALDAAPAAINERLLEAKGITHLIGRGESNFSGSSRSRIQNIRVSSEKFRGLFLEPGQEFSFGPHLGEIDEKSGYVPELVIKSGKLIPEFGGGICQVSTTLFRAAVYAGLKIIERFNHSIPVRYYGPPGFDATVYPPSPDLKFINTTSSTLYIQPRIIGTALTFDLYGIPDGRSVKVEGPSVTQRNPDGSIKTVVVQNVFDKTGALIQKKSFWSFYKNPEQYTIERNPLE